MKSSSVISNFINNEAGTPASKANPRDALKHATDRLEKVAYSNGVYEALSRIDLACCVDINKITKKQLQALIISQRNSIISDWKSRINPS